jgi:hypothetical protein
MVGVQPRLVTTPTIATATATGIIAIVNSHRGGITKSELVSRLSKILKRVDDALILRRAENAKSGRDAAEDDLLAALDIAVLELLRLGAMTTPR